MKKNIKISRILICALVGCMIAAVMPSTAFAYDVIEIIPEASTPNTVSGYYYNFTVGDEIELRFRGGGGTDDMAQKDPSYTGTLPAGLSITDHTCPFFSVGGTCTDATFGVKIAKLSYTSIDGGTATRDIGITVGKTSPTLTGSNTLSGTAGFMGMQTVTATIENGWFGGTTPEMSLTATITDGIHTATASTKATGANVSFTFPAAELNTLAAGGPYDITVNAFGGNDNNENFAAKKIGELTLTAPTFGISLSPAGDKTFPSQEPGYGVQTPYSVVVSNKGTGDAGALTVELDGANPGDFELSKTALNVTSGVSDSFTITPRMNLEAGIHTAIVSVIGNNGISESFNVSFTVTHTLIQVTAKDATCGEAGNTEYWYCESCGKYFSNSAGTTEIELSSTIIPATENHTTGDGWQHDATGHWKVCSVCNQEVEKTVHSGGTANCHEKASCEFCGAEYGALAPDNHDGETEIRDKKEATETEDGYTGDTYCKGCNKVISTGTIIPATGHIHSWSDKWTNDGGTHWHECTSVDCPITENSGKDGYAAHTAGKWIDDKPLSENELSRKHQECTVCGHTMAVAVTIKTVGVVEVKPGKDSQWTFYCEFKALKSLKLNGVEMGIVPLSDTSASLTYPGYKGIAGIAKAGSVEVTLYADFLKTLPVGTYTLEAEFASGKTTSIGSTEFTVSNDSKLEPKPDPNDPAPDKKPTPDKEPMSPTDVPATGDTSHVRLWVLLMLAALAVCGSLLAYWRLSNKKR